MKKTLEQKKKEARDRRIENESKVIPRVYSEYINDLKPLHTVDGYHPNSVMLENKMLGIRLFAFEGTQSQNKAALEKFMKENSNSFDEWVLSTYRG